jgi:hypothetical protein
MVCCLDAGLTCSGGEICCTPTGGGNPVCAVTCSEKKEGGRLLQAAHSGRRRAQRHPMSRR